MNAVEWPTPDQIIVRQEEIVRAAQAQLDEATNSLRQAVRFAVQAGTSQAEASRLAGVHRDTIKRWVADNK